MEPCSPDAIRVKYTTKFGSYYYTDGDDAYETAWRAVKDAAEALRYSQEHFQARSDGRPAQQVLNEARAVLAATPKISLVAQ